MGFFDEFEQLRSKTLSEWQFSISRLRDRTREHVQQHGEFAALAGFAGGVLVVLFFRVFCWLFFCTLVLAALIWLTAPEEK